jgi:hypothetical protein
MTYGDDTAMVFEGKTNGSLYFNGGAWSLEEADRRFGLCKGLLCQLVPHLQY